MTQEFHISVTPVGDNEYLVRTERVAPGVPLAEEQLTWAVEDWLAQARVLMNDPLLGLLRGNSAYSQSLPQQDDAALWGEVTPFEKKIQPNLVNLGRQLYNALFQGTVRDSWVMAQGIAQNRGEMLRLRLGLKGDLLPRLPWEVLHAGDRPLATGIEIVFSRYQSTFMAIAASSVPRTHSAADPNQPLKILMVVAAPTDQEVLDLKREAVHLQEELQAYLQVVGTRNSNRVLQNNGLPDIQLTILEQPGREQLAQALEQRQYQVFHYAGHSDLGAAGGDLYLVSNKTGLTEVLNGDDLAGLLVNNGVRMAVFNSCRGVYTATSGEDALEGNLAAALVKRGIPAVLAMAERIPDNVALTLSRLFYRNLKQLYPVDLSLSRARQGLVAAYGSNQLYWALPILYLHPEFDGYLQPFPLDRTSPETLAESRMTEALVEPIATGLRRTDILAADTADEMNLFDPGSEDLDEFIDDLEQDDPDYSEDSAAVAEMFRNLAVSDRLTDEALNLPDVELEGWLSDAEFGQSRITAGADLSDRVDQYSSSDQFLDLPDTPNPYTDLIGDQTESAELQAAIATYNQAVEIDPNDAHAYHTLGQALYKHGYLNEAIIAYNQAIQLNPDLTEIYNDLGIVLQRQGNLSAATAAYKQAKRPLPSRQAHQPQTSMAEMASEEIGSDEPEVLASENVVLTNERLSIQPKRRYPLALLGGAGVAAVMLLAVWLSQGRLLSVFSNREPTIPSSPVSSPLTVPDKKAINFASADTASLTALASQAFNQGDLVTGQRSVEALLDREALPQVKAVLDAVSAQQLEQPAINFLKGRLVWQYLQKGNSDYSVDDARRFWETAVNQQKNIPAYYNALGFAYYAEGNLERANQAWFRALYLAEEQAKQSGTQSDGKQPPVNSSIQPANRDALTAYAGLALVLNKSAQAQSGEKQVDLVDQSIMLRQKVLTEAAVDFQPALLAKNWLWTEAAIKDWQALQKL